MWRSASATSSALRSASDMARSPDAAPSQAWIPRHRFAESKLSALRGTVGPAVPLRFTKRRELDRRHSTSWPSASSNDAGPDSRLVRSVINPVAGHLSWMWPRCRTRRNPRVPRDLVGRLTVRIGRRDQHDQDRDRRHQHAGARDEQPSTECHLRRRGSGGGWRVGAMAGYSAPGPTSLPRTHGGSRSTAPTAWTRPPAPSPNQTRCTIGCLRPGRRADPPGRCRSCSAGRRARPRRQPRRPTVTTPRSSTRDEGVCPSIRDNPKRIDGHGSAHRRCPAAVTSTGPRLGCSSATWQERYAGPARQDRAFMFAVLLGTSPGLAPALRPGAHQSLRPRTKQTRTRQLRAQHSAPPERPTQADRREETARARRGADQLPDLVHRACRRSALGWSARPSAGRATLYRHLDVSPPPGRDRRL